MSHKCIAAMSAALLMFHFSTCAAQSQRDGAPKPRQPLETSPIRPGIRPKLSPQPISVSRSSSPELLREVRRVEVRIADYFGKRWGVDLAPVRAEVETSLRDVGIEVIQGGQGQAGDRALSIEVVVSKDSDTEGDLQINARLIEAAGSDPNPAAADPDREWHYDVSVKWTGTIHVPDVITQAISIVLEKFIRSYVAANPK